DGGDADRSLDRVSSVEGLASSSRYRTSTTTVARGVTLKRIRDRRGPRRIFVLTVDPRNRPTIDTGLARNRLPEFERTSSIARRHGAIAAVNGDFGLPSGRPAHAFAEDADLKQTSHAYGYNFAVTRDGSAAFIGHREVTLASVADARGDVWDVDRWNDGAPTSGQIAAFSRAARRGDGTWVERPPAHACSARLSPGSPPRWTTGETGVQTTHVVTAVGCESDRLMPGSGIVLSARPHSPEAAFVRSLAVDGTITLSWSLGWRHTLDTIGGYPELVRDGRRVAGDCSQPLCGRHPRTGVGIRRDGRIMLVVVDGRRRGWSVGMTLREFGAEMERLGAVAALNLDGGGSSTMWIRGRIVNRPSDGSERAISSAILVLPGGDAGETTPGASELGEDPAEEEMGATGDSERAGDLALSDPASTGGFLDALDAGVGGASGPLAPDLAELLERVAAAFG
ncbi:MAG TPA: phosphodiester glycosidase family protein, partial [Actinomycetota bacterium]|nr:phosphodiester glycosidase family protein [Actinomycetota bacterium]